MTRDDALVKLHEWVQSPALLRHMYTVEHVMRRAAPRYGGPDANAEEWAIAGLLHDADYEKYPDEHPQHIIAWLRERGEESLAYAVSAHSPRWGFPCQSAMDISGFWPATKSRGSSWPVLGCGPTASRRSKPQASSRNSKTKNLPPA